MDRRWPLSVAALLFLTSVGIALRLALDATGGQLVYALDDAYIHMAMAKNFAEHGVWGCTPFHFSSSSSSPLWTWLLAAAYATVGVHDAVPLVLNIVLGIAMLMLTDRYLTRWSLPAVVRAVTLIGVVIVTNAVGMVLMGMEHILHLLLTIWFAAAAAGALTGTAAAAGETRTGMLCALAALLSLSRYEGVFLVGVVCLAFFVRRQYVRGASIAVAAAMPVIAYGVFALANGGLFLPNSLLLKAGGASASPLAVLFKRVGAEDIAFFRSNPALLWLTTTALSVALLRLAMTRRPWEPRLLLPVWFVLIVLLHGHFVFSSTFWAYRYDAYLLGFGVMALAVALHRDGLAAHVSGKASVIVGAILVVLVAVTSNPCASLRATQEIAGTRNTLFEHVLTARFVRTYYPREVVAVNDLGAVTYFTSAPILDVVGLGDIEPLLISRRTGGYTAADVQAWTAAHHARIALIQIDWSWVAPRVPPDWTRVAEITVPTHGQHIAFFAVDPAAAPLLRANVAYYYGVEHANAGYIVRTF